MTKDKKYSKFLNKFKGSFFGCITLHIRKRNILSNKKEFIPHISIYTKERYYHIDLIRLNKFLNKYDSAEQDFSNKEYKYLTKMTKESITKRIRKGIY